MPGQQPSATVVPSTPSCNQQPAHDVVSSLCLALTAAILELLVQFITHHGMLMVPPCDLDDGELH